MTFQKFMEKYNLKNSATVKGWIDKGYIPGASFENNFIPDEARPPYTKSRSKKPGSIYVSIVRALINGYRPIPQCYKTITEKEFYDVYMASLIAGGLVIAVEDTSFNIINYYPSEKALEYVQKNDKELLSLLKSILGGIGAIIPK
jgi:hypothetical protein